MPGRHQDNLPPALPREFRAAWVATVDNIDWPSKRTLTPEEQQAEMIKILDRAVELKLNAIVFQVRPSADALYDSPLEPWSEYLTNKQGKGPGYDPLLFAVNEAHVRGLELHCWFNPYRAKHPAQKGPIASNHIASTNPLVVKSYGKYLWMDPGEEYVKQRTLDVMRDVVKRYDIDGVHIDDYFYPYPEKGIDFPDDRSWNAYVTGGGMLAKGDWRRKNVDDFVRAMYQTVKTEKRWVKVGISPFGIYRPGLPEGIKAGIDQYDALYADAKKWLNEGWCDYFTPQLYWSSKTPDQNYGALLNWWVSENTQKRHIWPGNYTSRLGDGESKAYPVQEILDQIKITRDTPGATGNVHFSFKAFTKDWKGINAALSTGPYAAPALIPNSPWLGGGKPSAPEVTLEKKFEGQWVAKITTKPETKMRFFELWVDDDGWKPVVVTNKKEHYIALKTKMEGRLCVRVVDYTGNESDPVVVDLR